MVMMTIPNWTFSIVSGPKSNTLSGKFLEIQLLPCTMMCVAGFKCRLQQFSHAELLIKLDIFELTQLPFATDPLAKSIPTGLLLIKNMELVDDILTFEELGVKLKTHGPHVASLSSFDFSAKNGIAGCLRSLLKQFMMVSLDVADLSILASWYGMVLANDLGCTHLTTQSDSQLVVSQVLGEFQAKDERMILYQQKAVETRELCSPTCCYY